MNVGVIGAGNIATAAHIPAIQSIPSLHINGIADLNEKRVKKAAKKFHIENWYTDYMKLMNDDTIEIINLCTPPQLRLPVIQAAAEKKKHVIIEKPLALSVEEACAIRRTANEHEILVTVVQNYRGFSSVVKAKERVAGGYVGNIVSMQGTALTPHPANQSKALHYYHPGGVLFDFGPHIIDMLLWLNGSTVNEVFAYGGDFTDNMGFVNYSQILLKFENKAVAVADMSWMTAIEGMRFTINIHGTGGHILLDVRNESYLEFHGVLTPIDDALKSVNRAISTSKGALTGGYFTRPFQPYHDLIVDFITAIQQKRKPAVSVEQAIMTTAVLEAAKKSIDEDRPIQIESLFKSLDEFNTIKQSLKMEH